MRILNLCIVYRFQTVNPGFSLSQSHTFWSTAIRRDIRPALYFSVVNCADAAAALNAFYYSSVLTRDVEAAISSTASASTPIASASTASASNRTWTLTEPGLYLIYELADKHDYQNQQLTIYKGTLLVKMIT